MVDFSSIRLPAVPEDFTGSQKDFVVDLLSAIEENYKRLIDMNIMIGRYGSGEGEFEEVRIDSSTNSLQTVDYAHHEIHAGSHYKKGFQNTALDDTDTVAVVFTTPDSTKFMHFVLTSQTTGPATVQLFRTPTLSAEGTAMTPLNRNENSSNTADMVVKHTPTITSNGTKIAEKWVGSEGFKENLGGETRGDSEIVLLRNTQYLALLTAEADDMKGAIGGDWYEHTDKN